MRQLQFLSVMAFLLASLHRIVLLCDQVILQLLRRFFVWVVDRSVSSSCSRFFSKLLDMDEYLCRTIACRMKFSKGAG